MPVKVEDPPSQIVVGEAFAPTEGRGFTVTVILLVAVAPQAFVAVTVYVWVFNGTKGTPSFIPPDQVKLPEPLAVSVTLLPAHTVLDGVAVILTVGEGKGEKEMVGGVNRFVLV